MVEEEAGLYRNAGSVNKSGVPSSSLALERVELEARATELRKNMSSVELGLQTYPLVLESARAYREHVADHRDFLKWVAAFSTAGLLFVSDQVRHDPVAVIPLQTVIGLVLAECAFVVSIVAAGLYFWRVDLPTGRYFESLRHRVGLEVSALRTIAASLARLEIALGHNELAIAEVALKEADDAERTATARGELPRPKLYDTEPLSVVFKACCLGGFGAGILLVALDQAAKTMK
jgi:hypothetical protein